MSQNKISIVTQTPRSYARRVFKGLSDRQKILMESELCNYTLSQDKIDMSKRLYLEIGFGNGENIVNLAQKNPDKIFVGCEVFLNGVVSVLSKIVELEIKNILLWPNDVNLLFNNEIDQLLFDGVYVLFPDPWPKRRQQKRRLLNQSMIEKIKSILKQDGYLFFGSDIADYFTDVKNIMLEVGFTEQNLDYTLGYSATKYHKKAVKALRKPNFIVGSI